MAEKKKKGSKYRTRLKKRSKLALAFGSIGFYTSTSPKNKGKKYPLPSPILNQASIVWVEE